MLYNMARSRWWPTPWTTVPSASMYVYNIYIHMVHCPQSLLGLQFIRWWPWKVPNCKSCLVWALGPRDDSMISGSMSMLAYLQLRSIFPRRSNARVLKCSCSGPLWLGSNICASQHQQFIPFLLSELLIFMTIEHGVNSMCWPQITECVTACHSLFCHNPVMGLPWITSYSVRWSSTGLQVAAQHQIKFVW